MPSLRQHSIDVLLANQTPGGAFLACPTMPDYRYSWFRDGSYIAYALDLVGEHAAAHRFHDWAAGVIAANAATVARAEACAALGLPPAEDAVLHTRYTVEGRAGSDAWPNFQLDGIGTWLWAVCDHAARHAEPLLALWREAVALAARYLVALWQQPNFDLWEENGDRRHTYTQAAIYGGLAAAGRALERPDLLKAARDVQTELLAAAERTGHFTKFLLPDSDCDRSPLAWSRRACPAPSWPDEAREPVEGPPVGRPGQADRATAVDGALIGVALPYGAVPADHPALARTVALIERDLRQDGGGVHRFAWDVYYGGGEWVLLTAWLGWYYAAIGQRDRARELLAWVEAQADPYGDLPEQVPQHLIDPSTYQPWVDVRGPIAKPLLWSHAKHLILREALEHTA
jgi:GH15 family glucan-1,4-alpha-glucosidase